MNRHVIHPWNTACPGAANCVEVQTYDDGSVDVRNSTDRTGPTVTFTAGEWDTFITGVKQGAFDPAS